MQWILVLPSVLFVLLSLAGSTNVAAQELNPARTLVMGEDTLVIGHRGAAAHAPENTIVSFLLALEANADFVELDYFETSDGVPVVFHDDRLYRTTNAAEVFGRRRASQPISSFSLAELRQLDAGKWYHRDFQGTGIPTLEEALEAIQSRGMTFIEHKGGEPATLIDLLERQELLGSVVVLSFDWNFITRCHALAPTLCVGCLGKETLTESKLDDIVASGATLVGWRASDLDTRDIERLHNTGLQVWAYTVNEERLANRLLAAEIDGLISDDPSWLRGMLDAR